MLSHMSHPDLLSAREVAAILNVSKATVKRLALAGTLPSFRVGGPTRGTYVFQRSDVDIYVAVRRAELVDAIAKLDTAS